MSAEANPDLLRSYVERIERLEGEIAELNADKSDVYKEAKGNGFDVKIIRKCVAIRKQDPAALTEEEALVELYMAAIEGRRPHVHVHEAPAREEAPHDPVTGEIHDLNAKRAA